MPDDLYHRDVLTWSEQQAGLLRRLAAGERVNDAVDWKNVIEEVEDVGISQLRACRSFLRQAMLHLLKLWAWPESSSVEHWQDEVFAFLDDARDRFSPSMRPHLLLQTLYADALRRVRARTDRSGSPRPLSDECPFTLDDLLEAEPVVDVLVAKLGKTDA